MYTALDLSKYIVSKCKKDNHPISNLQLQKILYYIQKEFLKKGSAAFLDEIEAWQFGPVVPGVYYHFCGFGAMPIFNSCDDYLINTEDASAIDRIIEEKRVLDPWVLVAETHKPGGAWERIYNHGQGNRKIIPVELIEAVG